jgi:ribonuclease P protein component
VRGERYLTRDSQFQLVYRHGRSWAGREVVIRAVPNGLELTRYGFAVGRRLGKAVVRNSVKRRLREIMRKTMLSPGWDIIVIARGPAVSVDYAGLQRTVGYLLNKAGLSVGKHEGISSGIN